MEIEERFWSKADWDSRDPVRCWPWLKGKNSHGYGQFSMKAAGLGMVPAHRVAYELEVGPIPDGLVLDHTCHNDSGCSLGDSCPHRACVNPAHLEPITHAENCRRGAAKWTAGARSAAKTHCPNRHPYDDRNTYTRNGKRHCRQCNRDAVARYKARRRQDGQIL